MPIYVKEINGRGYLYWQKSVYRGSGRSPKSVMRYIGPLDPRRRRKSIFKTIDDFLHSVLTPEPGEYEMRRWEKEQAKIKAEIEANKTIYDRIMGREVSNLVPPPSPKLIEKPPTPLAPLPAHTPAEAPPPDNLPTGEVEKEPSSDEGSSAPQSDDIGGVGEPSSDGGNQPSVG